jgi:diguanylate cyclase (GGDEF)-like protein/PAS domain S-box-containing protein
MTMIARPPQALPARVNRAVVDGLPDGVAILSSGRIFFANTAFSTLSNRPPTRLLGGTLGEVLDHACDDIPLDSLDEHSTTFRLNGRSLTLTVKALDTEHALALLRDITAQAETDQALRETERRYRGIFENAVEGIYQSTARGDYVDVNPALARIYGYADPESLKHELTDIAGQLYVDPSARQRFKDLMERHGVVTEFEAQIRRKDGQVIWITENARSVRTRTGQLLYYEGTVEDITARKHAEAEIRMLAKVFESVAEGILLVDADLMVREVNPAYAEITDTPAASLIGQPARLLAAGFHEKTTEADIWAVARNEGHWRGEVWLERAEERPFLGDLSVTTVRDDTGAVLRFVAAVTDITRRKEDEERIRFQANYDTLTRLPNRHLITDRLEQAILRAENHGGRVGVLFLDLDRFKYINDSYGHAVGDALLKLAARRLSHCVRPSDGVGRLGGDEFMIVLPDCGTGNTGAYIAEKVLYSLSEPFAIAGTELFSVPSIGIAYWPEHGETAHDLIRRADLAMYHAKRGDERRYTTYLPSMEEKSLTVLNMENDLRLAIASGEFELHFQPKVCAGSGAVLGAEALVRWPHPEHGMISPLDFIPLAEDNGLIMPLGRWILREACLRMMAWRAEGIAPPNLSVNVSPRQFSDPALAETIARTLEETGLPPHCLDLEITESVTSGDVERVIATMDGLKSMGITLSVDDFGTGYSSLNYLKRFPIDTLKIDQSFVRDLMDTAGKDAAICATVITLGTNLGFTVVAEGVETADQARFLFERGCHMLQGYWISRPLPADAFSEWMRKTTQASCHAAL